MLMDGEPVKSCTVLAATAEPVTGSARSRVLRSTARLDPVQEGFSEEHGLQCGFCTPGMMLTARALLDRRPGVAATAAAAHRRRDPRGDLGADLPLHRLRDDRPVDPLGGASKRRGGQRNELSTSSVRGGERMTLDRCVHRLDDRPDPRDRGDHRRRGDRDHDRGPGRCGSPSRPAAPSAASSKVARAIRRAEPASAGSTTRACGSCTRRGRCGRWRWADDRRSLHPHTLGAIALTIGLVAALAVARSCWPC